VPIDGYTVVLHIAKDDIAQKSYIHTTKFMYYEYNYLIVNNILCIS